MGEIKTAKDAVKFIKEEGIEIVDFRFMDFPGLWQHFSTIPREVDEKVFEEGLGFDGSSIRGWQAINESDMLVKPVPESAFVDPFFKAKTLVFICNICDPVTGEDYTRDPRNIARKAENYMKSLGWLIRPTLDLRQNSLSLTIFALIRINMKVIIMSTLWKADGIREEWKNPTWVISLGTKKATFRSPRPIACRIYGAR